MAQDTEKLLEGVFEDITRFKQRLQVHTKQWRRNLRYYHGYYDTDEIGQRNVITNLIFGLVHRIIPSVYFKNPHLSINPRGKTPKEQARLWEVTVNYLFSVLNTDQEIRKVAFDVLFKGIGFIKLGVISNADSAPRGTYGGVSEQNILEALMGVVQQMQGKGEEPERGTKEFKQAQIETGYREGVQSNKPYMVRVPPQMLVPDRYATCIDNSRFLAHLILKPMSELEKMEGVSAGLVNDIEPTFAERSMEDMHAWNEVGEMEGGIVESLEQGELVELWEIWHKPTMKVYLTSDYLMGDGKFLPLKKKDWPYDFDEFPFEDLRFNQDPDSWFGIADVSTWDSLVTGYNYVQSLQARHVSRFNRKYLVTQAVAEHGVLDALTSDQDGAHVVVPGESVVGKVEPLKDAPLPHDAYMMKRELRDDLTFVSGVTYQRQGFQQKGETTATEASILEGQAQLRDNDRLFHMSRFLERGGRKLVMLCKQSLSLGDLLFISMDPELMAYWQQVSPEMSKAEVDVRVAVGSTGFKTKDVRIKQLLDYANVLARFPDPQTGGPILNVRELALRIAQEFDIPEVEKLLYPQIPPGPEYMAQQGGSQHAGAALQTGAVGNPGIQNSRVQNVSARPNPNPTEARRG